jgi:hypothetical protein
LYNLFVASERGLWRKGACEIERERSISSKEFTEAALARKFGSFSAEAIENLLGFPCLFAYEDTIKKPARIGWLTAIKPREREVRVEFAIDDSLPEVSAAKLKKFSSGLDIADWSLNRRHWAVKEIDLVDMLRRAGLLDQKAFQRFAKSGHPLTRGLAAPAAALRVRSSVFRIPKTGVESDLVSVMMPFSGFDGVLTTLRAAAKECSLRCHRADDIWDEPEVIQDVFSLIYRSRLVICDCTNRNPNVFYEAGIAHTLGKPVIFIAQNKADIPFDLGHLRYVTYLPNKEGRKELKEKVISRLRTIINK